MKIIAIISFVVSFTLGEMLLYSLLAFYFVSIDPAQWSQDGRFVFVLFSVIIILVSISFTFWYIETLKEERRVISEINKYR